MKKWLIVLLLLSAVIAGIGFYLYQSIQSNNIEESKAGKIFYVNQNTTFQQLLDTLQQRKILKSPTSFRRVAQWMGLNQSSIKAGKYEVQAGWNNRTLVNVIRSGRQVPTQLIINNVRTIHDLAGSIADQVEMDSVNLIQYILSPATLSKTDLDSLSIMSIFIPNTYEVWWTISPEKFIERMINEHHKWWNQSNRLQKLEKKKLSKAEAYTLASIVDKETNLVSEKPVVAGVYLNRLERDIPLQADPTVVFASGDYTLKRVLNKHLAIDSPYNTYKYGGLPPGPIYMPSISGLEAVLNAKDHNYLYFCAAPGYSSEHQFAKTLTAHNMNARKYHRWLNKEGIK